MPSKKIHIGSFTSETGLNLKNFLLLTGITGVVPFEELNDSNLTIYIRNTAIQVILVEDRADINVFVNSKTKKIRNEMFVANISGNDFAIKRLIVQTDSARKENYKQIELCAANEEYIDESLLVGYKIWWKYGFVMNDKYKTLFTTFLYDVKINEKYRNFLLAKDKTEGKIDHFLQSFDPQSTSLYSFCSLELGYICWEEFGDEWSGYFELERGSESDSIFSKLIKAKGYNDLMS